MRLLVLYFSGTGNTDYVARYLARKLADQSLDIELRSVERQPAETVDGFDVLAFGFPVYACDSPDFVHGYLARLAPGRGRGAFAFCTKGAAAGGAVIRNLRRLANRGYVPLGGGSVGMPGSDGLAFLGKNSAMARTALNKDYDHLKAADRLAGRMATVLAGLSQGESAATYRQPVERGLAGRVGDWLWATSYDLICERFRTRFWADARCAGCGLCAQICPVDNVEMRDGHAHFGEHCGLCMRCLHNCPQEAIQIGKGTVDRFRWRGPLGKFRPLHLRPTEPTQRAVLGGIQGPSQW